MQGKKHVKHAFRFLSQPTLAAMIKDAEIAISSMQNRSEIDTKKEIRDAKRLISIAKLCISEGI